MSLNGQISGIPVLLSTQSYDFVMHTAQEVTFYVMSGAAKYGQSAPYTIYGNSV